MTEAKNQLQTSIETLVRPEIVLIEERDRHPFLVKHRDWVTESLEGYCQSPLRIRERLSFDRVNGFVSYVNAYKGAESIVFAAESGLTAIFDYHGKDRPAWAQHRATYNLRHTPEWVRWKGFQGQWMDQGAFANFIEENLDTIEEPKAADLLQVVKSMRAVVTQKYTSVISDDGIQAELEFKKEQELKGGKGGSLTVPKQLTIVLKAYDGLESLPNGEQSYRLKVRLQYDIPGEGRGIRFSYSILNFRRAELDAFDGVLDAVEKAVQLPMYPGGSVE